MKHLDLTNPENAKSIQEILRAGANSEFWKVICQRLQESIESIQTQLDSDAGSIMAAEEYKITREILRKQKQDRLDILSLPEDLVKELENPEFFKQDREEEIYKTKEDF